MYNDRLWYAKRYTIGYHSTLGDICAFFGRRVLVDSTTYHAIDRVLQNAIARHIGNRRATGRASLYAHCKTYRPKRKYSIALQCVKMARPNDKPLHRAKAHAKTALQSQIR